MQLHRAFQAQQQQPQADPVAPTTAASDAAESSCNADAGCPRCTALASTTAAAAAAGSDSSEWSRLHRDALAFSPPFATLNPNLSQLAFCVQQPQQQPAQTREETSAVAVASSALAEASTSSSSAASAAPPAPDDTAAALSISELLTPAGFLRWEAFTPLAAAASAAASASSVSFSPTSSSAESLYAASSSRLVSACESLHSYLSRMDRAEFQRRYTEQVQAASQHGSTLGELFAMYQNGYAEEEAQGETTPMDAASASASSSLAPSRFALRVAKA